MTNNTGTTAKLINLGKLLPAFNLRGKLYKVLLHYSLGKLWTDYNSALIADPLIVKSITAGIVMGAADLAGQAIENAYRPMDAKSSIDYKRSGRFAFFGLFVLAPWTHYYYMWLDYVLPPTEYPFSISNGEKVFFDQFIQSPFFTAILIGVLAALEGKSLVQVQEQLQDTWKTTVVNSWKLWVPATAINMGFVPPMLRVLFTNAVFFIWSIYLSLNLTKTDDLVLVHPTMLGAVTEESELVQPLIGGDSIGGGSIATPMVDAGGLPLAVDEPMFIYEPPGGYQPVSLV